MRERPFKPLSEFVNTARVGRVSIKARFASEALPALQRDYFRIAYAPLGLAIQISRSFFWRVRTRKSANGFSKMLSISVSRLNVRQTCAARSLPRMTSWSLLVGDIAWYRGDRSRF